MKSKFIYLPVSLLLAAGLASAQEKPFSLKGKLEGDYKGPLYLIYTSTDEKMIVDSTVVENGRFAFSGKLPGPVMTYLVTDFRGRAANDPNRANFFIEPRDMTVTLRYNQFAEAQVSGSATQQEMNKLNEAKAAINEQLKPLSKAYDEANRKYIEARQAKKDEATLQALKDKATQAKDAMDPYLEQMGQVDMKFIEQNPNSYITAYLLRYRISGMPLKKGESYYNKMSPALQQSPYGLAIKKELDELRAGSPGATAYVFASNELRGGQLSLADYKGKYVLIDFWASWCVPCRKGNPHLLALYSKYKDKGLEIIGISDDDSNPEAWKKAVDQDKIGVWKHVLRGLKRAPDSPMGFDRSADISDRYGISTLPTKILVDPKGVIIGRYGGGGEDDEAMDKKLAEVFGY